MRPTVLNTPKLAAEYTHIEEKRLPGVAAAEFDNADDERKLIEAERKRELQKYKANKKVEGFYTPGQDDNSTNTVPLDISEPRSTNSVQNVPGPEIDEVTPVPQVVHPQAGILPPPAPPADNSAPLDSAAMQQKAQAALAQKMLELNSTNSGH